jgi:hypothetical protein
MPTYPITKDAKEKVLNIIQDILHNNRYNKNLAQDIQIHANTTKTQINNTRKLNGTLSLIVGKNKENYKTS